MPAEIIARTKRTQIRKIALTDAPFIFDLVRTPQWIKYIGDRGLNTLADAERYVEKRFLEDYQQYKFGYYLVSLSTAEPIGVAGFLKRTELENVDYGFAFMPDYHGRGFGYEVSEELLDFASVTFAFDTLDAVTMGANTPSKRLLEKLGFKDQGLILFGERQEENHLYRWHK